MSHPVSSRASSFSNTSFLKYGLISILFWSSLGAYFTSVSAIALWLDGIHTNWFHLSLNYFSRVWIWVLITPVVYKVYRSFRWLDKKIFYKLPVIAFVGISISVVHVFSATYLDVSLRSWLHIIELDYWMVISNEIPLLIRSISNSLVTLLFMTTIFICNDHYHFMGRSNNGDAHLEKGQNISPIERPTSKSTQKNNKLVVKSNGKIKFLCTDVIKYITAKGNYVQISTGSESITVRSTLSAMNDKLPSGKFFRVSRSTVVNQDFIIELEPWFNGEYIIHMTDGSHIKTGRAFRRQLSLLINDLTT